MNNNKKLIVATLAGLALCCTTLAAPGHNGGRHGGHGVRGGAPMHQMHRAGPGPAHHAHRPPPPPAHHHHHRDGLGLAAGIVNLVHDIIAPEPIVVQQPTTVVQTTPVVYQTPTVYQTTPTVYQTTPTVYQGW